MAPVLTLHRGGAHPAEQARLEREAERVLNALVDALPASDNLREAAGLIADALAVRRFRGLSIADEVALGRDYPPRGA